MVNICTAPDLYTAQLFEKQSVWVATLSTGEDVIQDDDREGEEPPSAWLRLGKHCEENDCYITEMYIQNGTNKIEMEIIFANQRVGFSTEEKHFIRISLEY